MALQFQSLRSGSSGNCLMLWTEATRILIDCGVAAQFRCRDLLEEHVGDPSDVDAVVVTHAHTDHIRYDSLKVFENFAVPVYCHEECLPQIYDKHRAGKCGGVPFMVFTDREFRVGDFTIEPIRVSHHPRFLTHGFAVRCRQDERERKVVLVTDFNDYTGIVDHFSNADFIFVEANYDPDLLKKHFNPNSLYHMENSKTARLLSDALARSETLPVAVMLGHLSQERNSSDLALETVRGVLEQQSIAADLALHAAPRHSASAMITIE